MTVTLRVVRRGPRITMRHFPSCLLSEAHAWAEAEATEAWKEAQRFAALEGAINPDDLLAFDFWEKRTEDGANASELRPLQCWKQSRTTGQLELTDLSDMLIY